MKKFRFYLFILFTVVNLSCSRQPALVQTEKIQYRPSLHDTLPADSAVTAFVHPYKIKLDSSMNRQICECETAMLKGTPESLLGNFVADLCLAIARQNTEKEIDFCFLNNGGLRNSLPQGIITVRNIYELMPFDNEMVIIELDGQTTEELIHAIVQAGGVPVSGIKLTIGKQGPVEVKIKDQDFDKSRNYHILTSDYLANGGDKYDFLKKRISYLKTGKLVRDAIIEHCMLTAAAGKKIRAELDKRITYE